MEKSLLKTISGEEFIFDYRRVMYWPRSNCLIASDLHWGKTHYLRQHGIAVSDDAFDEDLNRLADLIEEYSPQTLLVLGDLIHHEQSLNLNVEQKIASFREQYPCELILLRGNHDRYTTFPDSWGIVEENDFYIKNFYFSHEFQSGMKDFQFSGHVHPMIRLKGGYDELRFPAFILGQEFCLLPAFSYLTGGRNIRLQKGQEALIVTNSGMDLIRKV